MHRCFMLLSPPFLRIYNYIHSWIGQIGLFCAFIAENCDARLYSSNCEVQRAWENYMCLEALLLFHCLLLLVAYQVLTSWEMESI